MRGVAVRTVVLEAAASEETIEVMVTSDDRVWWDRYAKRYVDRSSALDAGLRDHRGFTSHAEYLDRLRDRHGRKFSFWKLFDDPGLRPSSRAVASRE